MSDIFDSAGHLLSDRTERERMIFGRLKIFFIFVLVSILLYQISVDLGHIVSRLGLSLLLFFCAVLCGALPGFLFALPRTPSTSSGQAQGEPESNRVRTGNLEEIADWLTKILLGVGLIQLNGLSSRLWHWSTTLSKVAYSSESHAPLVLCLLLSGAILGFLYGYLATRLKINLLLISEDRKVDEFYNQAVAFLNKNVTVTAENVEQAKIGRDTQSAAVELTNKKFEQTQSKEEKIAWARAQVVLRRWTDAAMAYKAISNEYPDDLEIRLEYTRALQQARDFSGADQVAKQLEGAASNDESLMSELKLDEMMRLLYEPGAYDKVIALSKELAANPNVTRQARYWVYTAAAHGQQYQDLQSKNAPAVDLQKVRTFALDAARRAIASDKKDTWKMFLQGLVDPKSVPGHPDDENDLEGFKNDSDFRKLLGMS